MEHAAPNILWLCTDQQRWDTLGCYGNPYVSTPNLDRLASEGALFERAFCQSPVCTPSRASMLTGRYPRTTRCRANGQSIPADEVLVTKLLADSEYTCGLAGKLHLSACHPSATPTMERRIDDGYGSFHWSHHPAPLPSATYGLNNWPTNEYSQWLQQRGVDYQWTPQQGSMYVQQAVTAENSQTNWCADKTIGFLETAASFKQPWLFSANFFDPHHPFDPPASYLERYLDFLDEIPLPDYVPGELENKPIFQRTDHEGAYGGLAGYPYPKMSDRDHRLVRAAYWAMCDLIDDQVGRILEALDASGQRDNTIVIFMSDHGEMLGDHGMYLKGPYFYEPAIRVPLIVRWPGVIEAGKRHEGMVELVDLAPTLLEAANLPMHPGMQGRSLWTTLTGGDAPEREDVYCEYYDAMPWHQKIASTSSTMVRTGRHKLVAYHAAGTGELYDLSDDPLEQRNRWDDPDFTSVKLDLLERLCNRMAETVDPLPPRQAAW